MGWVKTRDPLPRLPCRGSGSRGRSASTIAHTVPEPSTVTGDHKVTDEAPDEFSHGALHGELNTRLDQIETWRDEHMAHHAAHDSIADAALNLAGDAHGAASEAGSAADDAQSTAEIATIIAADASETAHDAADAAEDAADAAEDAADASTGTADDDVTEIPTESAPPPAKTEAEDDAEHRRHRRAFGRR